MDTISREKVDNLFWLGRYVERAYFSIKFFMKCADALIDGDDSLYKNLCETLYLNNTCVNEEEFLKGFIYDQNNPSSVIYSFTRAMDNALILRETIGTESLSYLQLTFDEMKKDRELNIETNFISLQKYIDIIFSFWGSIEDYIDEGKIRNIIKSGKRIERLDLSLRLDSYSLIEMKNALKRLRFRLDHSPLSYNKDNFNTLENFVNNGQINKDNALLLVNKLMVM